MQLNLVGGGHIVGSNLIAGGSGGQEDPSGGLKMLGIKNGIAKLQKGTWSCGMRTR